MSRAYENINPALSTVNSSLTSIMYNSDKIKVPNIVQAVTIYVGKLLCFYFKVKVLYFKQSIYPFKDSK